MLRAAHLGIAGRDGETALKPNRETLLERFSKSIALRSRQWRGFLMRSATQR
jgi:hypothetical protein